VSGPARVSAHAALYLLERPSPCRIQTKHVGCHLKIAKTTTGRTALAILSPALTDVLGIAVEDGAIIQFPRLSTPPATLSEVLTLDYGGLLVLRDMTRGRRG
jgi:hypothetical protein